LPAKNQLPFLGEQETLQLLHFTWPFDGRPAPELNAMIPPIGSAPRPKCRKYFMAPILFRYATTNCAFLLFIPLAGDTRRYGISGELPGLW
jgi:hypothetical protein